MGGQIQLPGSWDEDPNQDQDGDGIPDSQDTSDEFVQRAQRVLRAFDGSYPIVRIDVLEHQLRRMAPAERQHHLFAVAYELGRRSVIDNGDIGAFVLARQTKSRLVFTRALADVQVLDANFASAYLRHADRLDLDLPPTLTVEDLQSVYEDLRLEGFDIVDMVDMSMFDMNVITAQIDSIMAMIEQFVNPLSLGRSVLVGAGAGAAAGAVGGAMAGGVGAGPGAVGGAVTGAVGGAVAWALTEMAEAEEAGSRDDDGDGTANRYDDDMDGDDIPNDEDDDRDGDGVPDEDDEYPDDSEKDITPESEGGWMLMALTQQLLGMQFIQQYEQQILTPFMLELVQIHYYR